jgi:hypothetical protein
LGTRRTFDLAIFWFENIITGIKVSCLICAVSHSIKMDQRSSLSKIRIG